MVASIDDGHHVVRHCKKKLLIRDGEAILGVFPDFFHLRPAEKYLSAIYYEFFDGEPAARAMLCRDALSSSLQLRPKDGLVRLGVALIKEQGTKRKTSLRVTHEPEPECQSYAAIRGLPANPDHELNGLLADLAVLEILEVASIVP